MTNPRLVDRDRLESQEHWKGLPEDDRAKLIELIEGGSAMQATKYFRARTGLGLADSQAAIDAVTVGGSPRPSSSAPVPLSRATDRRLRLVFEPEYHDEATRVLEGMVDPGMGETPAELERVRFAALKCSEGALPGLRGAVDLAREDWRDLLMAAGFGHDVSAHEHWLSEKRWWEFWK